MKTRNYNFEVKKTGGYVALPPEGTYIGKIIDVRADKYADKKHDMLVLMIDITDGEYAGRYMEQYNDAKERYPDTKYKGTYRIYFPEDGDPAEFQWMQNNYQNSFWAIYECNPGYTWNWDENSLKGKKIGFTVRRRLYTYNGTDRETTEIGRLDSIEEIKAGKVKLMNPKDNRTGDADNSSSEGTDVTGKVDVPF